MTNSGGWLGIDLGTSSVKAMVIDRDGSVVNRGSCAVDVETGDFGEKVHRAEGYRIAVATAVRDAVGDSQISAVGLSGHTPSLVAADDRFEPTTPVLLWLDQSANAEAEELAELFGDPLPLVGTHLPWVSANLPAKLLWMQRHYADAISQSRWLLQPKDLVGGWLTGVAATDRWSSKGLCDVLRGVASTWLFEHAALDPRLLPPAAQAWEAQGTTVSGFATEIGLPLGVPVTVGWSDALAAMLTAGVFKEPTGFVLAGTSDIVGISTDRPPVSAAPLFHVPRTCAPSDLVYGPTQSSGASRVWAKTLLGGAGGDVESRLVSDVGPETPIFVPYLAGERAPLWNADVRGAFLGVDLAHDSADLFDAVLVGVGCSDRHVLETALDLTGDEPSTVVVMDSAPDAHWSRIKASVFGRPVTRRSEPMASAYGAAMLGAALTEGLAWALERLGPTATVVAPGQGGDAVYHRYRRASQLVQEWSTP